MTLPAADGSARTAVHVADAVEHSLLLTSCVLLLAYLRRNRHSALRGDAGAARKLILPAFEPLLWSLSAATLLLLSLALASLLALSGASVRTVPLLLLCEAEYAGRQFAQLLVPVFLLHKSVSLPALRRSALLTLALASYSLPIALALQLAGASSVQQWLLPIARLGVLAFYVRLVLRPPARASRRTLREYCAFAVMYHGLQLASSLAFLRSASAGSALVFATVVWSALLPLAVWRVLKADTEHWRGLGQRACALQRDLCLRLQTSSNAPDLHERISSQGLHVLIEMHRKLIIDFAHLEVCERIGAGASAAVFRGVLRSRLDVAVKVYTPADLTDETVAAFSHEAALCGSLRHPNIVRFLGMCVLPPTICLVSELCQGSLDVVTRALSTSNGAQRQHRRATRRAARLDTAHKEDRDALVEIAYMLDAARAVAYLHSFSPPFLHRDIKPSNFLVDARHRVKLTDFGESRSLPREHQQQSQQQQLEPGSASETSASDGATSARSPADIASARRMTVRGTVEYMAPELISGRAGTALYAEAADVYALGMTLWDVLFPTRDKFPALQGSHLAIFEAVLRGQRPTFDASNMRVPPELRQVIERTWEPDARSRPTASQVVSALERVQEQALAEFVGCLLAFSDDDSASAGVDASSSTSEAQVWTGEALARRIGLAGASRTHGEADRLGNAFMDAGLLHHWRHDAGFEPTALHRYVVDEANARLFQSIGPPDPLSASSSVSSLALATGSDKLEGLDVGDDASDGAETVVSGSRERRRFYSRRHYRQNAHRDVSDQRHRRRCRQGIGDLADLLGRVHLRGDPDQQPPSPRRPPSRAPSTTAISDASFSRLEPSACACRRLGQHLEGRQGDLGTSNAKLARHGRGRLWRGKTEGAVAVAVERDEHALTAELLARDGSDDGDSDREADTEVLGPSEIV